LAKRKAVAPATSDAPPQNRDGLALNIASALFAGMLVYVTYYPSDSVAIERGDGLWFAAIAIATSTIVWAVSGRSRVDSGDARALSVKGWSSAIDFIAILLAVWMMVAAFGVGTSGNLRQATNEAWFWVSIAAVFTASRRMFADPLAKRVGLVLLIGCSVGLAVHAMHQHFVSLPRTLSEYRADPDAVLRMAGIDAPPGSPGRMVFENRLVDGGPTGTFALANSLAGVLMIGFLVVGGLMVTTVRQFVTSAKSPRWVLMGGIATLGLVFAGLFFTHSRSGLAAAILGVGIFAVLTLSRRGLVAAVSGLVAMVIAVMMFAVYGKDEWVAQAPSSLAFRFQYWRSTWRLVIDRPWFGAGPGNFQAVYPMYREASAAETIAEPHNFFFETLAAGGFVASAILVAMFVAVLVFRRRLTQQTTEESVSEVDLSPHAAGWWWLGGGSSLTLIWLLGLATGQAPDWEAQILAVPLAIVAMVLAWKALSIADKATPESERQIDAVVFSAMTSLLVHLVVSGGWTVPGVILWFWALAGMWVPTMRTNSQLSSLNQDERSQPNKRTRGVAIAVGLALLVVLRFMSLGPVEASASAMRAALAAQSQRQTERAIQELERASEADPWSPESSLWLSDFYRWKLIQNRENESIAKKWLEASESAIKRSGDDPSLIGLVAAQPLHLYQRWGRESDLERAMQLYRLACEKSPTHAGFLAQRAEIAERAGDLEQSISDAKLAFALSELGENLERRLWIEQILVVDHLGFAAASEPIRKTANVLLENQLDTSSVMGETK
jgi:O-Antigen ligase